MKKTALYDLHVGAGGRMVDFAGFALPVQYEAGVIQEHKAVRECAGLFDVSHMGEFVVSGPDSLANLNRIMTNNFTNLKVGAMRYTVMCAPDGGAIDDLIVGRLTDDRFLLVVNAANKEKDQAWIQSELKGQVMFEDISDEKGLIALQGPEAERILRQLTDQIPDKNYRFLDHVRLMRSGEDSEYVDDCFISRTGYTGEDGFEIMCAWADTPTVWTWLMSVGQEYGLKACGLGARDTLRLEAAMPLYGHELTSEITPLEAGLGFAVKADDEMPFVGQAAMMSKDSEMTRVGLRLVGKGIAREGAEILVEGDEIGHVTSGTMSPTLGHAIAMGYVLTRFADVDTKVDVQVRQKTIEAVVVAMPFYKRSK